MRTRIIFIPDEHTHLTFDSNSSPEAVLTAVKLGTWEPRELTMSLPLNLGGLPLEACLIAERAVLIYHPSAMEPRYIDIAAVPQLTPRQIEVLQTLAAHNNIKEAARVMGISKRSVYSLLAGVRKRLNLPTNMHALSAAAELGIVPPRN